MCLPLHHAAKMPHIQPMRLIIFSFYRLELAWTIAYNFKLVLRIPSPSFRNYCGSHLHGWYCCIDLIHLRRSTCCFRRLSHKRCSGSCLCWIVIGLDFYLSVRLRCLNPRSVPFLHATQHSCKQ